jgi:predicted acetyltransferase
MALLSRPTMRVHASFLVAMDEFKAEGRGQDDDMSMLGREIRKWSGRWADPEGFASYVARLRADALEESPRPAGFVPGTTLWWVNDQEYLGRITIRHRLTEALRDVGGHIGYDVRPSARRRGHATAMLAAALPVARGLGIDRALLTCDHDNMASRRVIEANGGVLEDKHGGTLRYWVRTF